MTSKRYTEQARSLLGDFVEVFQSENKSRARALLGALLKSAASPAVVSSTALKSLATAPDNAILEILRRLEDGLRLSLRFGSKSPPGIAQRHQLRVSTTIVVAPRQRPRIEVDGDIAGLALLRFVELMSIAGDYVLRCDCERIFVKRGASKYCSIRCQKRYYMRGFRSGARGRND